MEKRKKKKTQLSPPARPRGKAPGSSWKPFQPGASHPLIFRRAPLNFVLSFASLAHSFAHIPSFLFVLFALSSSFFFFSFVLSHCYNFVQGLADCRLKLYAAHTAVRPFARFRDLSAIDPRPFRSTGFVSRVSAAPSTILHFFLVRFFLPWTLLLLFAVRSLSVIPVKRLSRSYRVVRDLSIDDEIPLYTEID